MQQGYRIPLVLLVLTARLVGAQAPRCAAATIAGDGVGVIRIGMPLDSVRARCPILRDTIEMNEGEAGRVAYALVAGDTVRIDVLQNSVWFIKVRRPRFATTDSIRVGTALAQFLIGRRPTILVGEGKVYLLDHDHCGNSFGLSAEAYRQIPRNDTALARLPRSTVIEEILVRGTSRRLPNGRCS
jgi:hypothetical protein